MCPSRRTVETDSKAIQLRIDADDRFAAAAGGAARYFADTAGLESKEVARLQAATVSACREAFENLTPQHPQLEVTLTKFADRIEVALRHRGAAVPAVGLDSIAGVAAHLGAGMSGGALGGVDRVQYDTQGDVTVTRLTKYLGPPTPAH